MENPVPFHINVVAVAIILCSCNEKHVVKNIADVTMKTSRGITMVNDTIFTGTLVSFYNNGDSMEVNNYRNGMKTGLQKRWWENGAKRSEYSYHDNEFHGTSKDWSQAGILIRQMNYDNGHENGLQQLWDDEGKIRANYVARNGRNYGLTGVKGCASIWEGDSVRVH